MTTTSLVFDPFSQEYYDNPYDTYRRMRQDAPVYYSEHYDFYALSRHADVAAGFKNHRVFSSASGVELSMVQAGGPPEGIRILQFMDPPDHRHMRSVLNKLFTPRAIQSRRDIVTAAIDKHLAAIGGQEFDLVGQFTALFPVEVITTMLGIPDEFVQKVRLWTDEVLHRDPGQSEIDERGYVAIAEQMAYYLSLVAQRREQPGDDIFSLLVGAEIERDDGGTGRLEDLEIAGFGAQLGGAGAETVTKLLANAAYLFAQRPEQWERLHADRSLIPAAVEELLRFDNPVHYDVRCSVVDTEMHGVAIPAGKPVFLLLASANRDAEAWTDADTFDIDRNRTEAQNLGLGYGIHSCLGAALARMETAIALDRMLDFMPRYEVDWAGCTRVQMANVGGWSRVPVRVTG